MTGSPAVASGVDDAAVRTLNPETARADAVDRREPSPDQERAAAADGGLWRGPTEGPWIARLLRGAPAPRDPAPPPVGRIPATDQRVSPPRP